MSKHFNIVFERDNRRCVYCGRDMIADFETFMIVEEDHLVPKSRGGDPDDPDNIVTSCAVCNRLKGAYKPDFDLNFDNRHRFIQNIREYLCGQRATKLADFESWTHPVE